MKIAILYICTGKYNQFFSEFYKSCEQYFLTDLASKHYFVFTDDMELTTASNVQLIKRECQGFPMDSLFRFEMFLSIKKELDFFDYIFFFNANMLFVAPIGMEFLPTKEGLMAVIHPGFYWKPACLFPYERNKRSKAYIGPSLPKYNYYMGSLNGGKTTEYLELINSCAINTRIDYNAGIIAVVHDESHLNKYLSEHVCLGLSPAYAYPEDWKLPFDAKIILRDKVKVDYYFNKGRRFTLWARFSKGCSILWNVFRWYLRF